MSNTGETLATFRQAAWAHLHAAECVITAMSEPLPSRPARTPASVAYLAHVALECAAKARILYRGGISSVDDLEKKHPKVYKQLFQTRHGHDLKQLAQELQLEGLMKLNGSGLKPDTWWKRMTQQDRPYSLRYGTEVIDATEAAEDVVQSKKVADVLLQGIRAGKKQAHGA